MTEQTSKALEKLRDELAAKTKHQGVQMIGERLCELVTENEAIADKLLAEGKTIEGAFDAVRGYASSHRTGNYAFVPPDKATEIIGQYFGIVGTSTEPMQAPKPPKAPDALDLDALLEI